MDLVDQFVAQMVQLERYVPFERRADWLVVATRLLLLRSRLAFPASPAAAADAEREAARELRRLDDLGHLRTVVGWLDRQVQLGRDAFVRPAPFGRRTTGYVELMEACLCYAEATTGRPGAGRDLRDREPRLLECRPGDSARIRDLLTDDSKRSLWSFVPWGTLGHAERINRLIDLPACGRIP